MSTRRCKTRSATATALTQSWPLNAHGRSKGLTPSEGLLGLNAPLDASTTYSYSSTRVGSGCPEGAIKTLDFSTDEDVIDPPTVSSTRAQIDHDRLQLRATDRHQFVVAIHPEGLPYFYQDKLVTSDNMDDPRIKKLLANAVALVCYMLKHMKDTQDDFTFHEEVELCVELKTTSSPPEFNYYIADHAKQTIFWADSREPESLQDARGVVRDNILHEEYWKHVEYYPCHREVPQGHIEDLKNLMAACATGKYAATSEGSTSPMSAKDIASHITNLNAFGEESKGKRTWAVGRIFGLFIRSQILNRYGMQNARLDRFASLEDKPPAFQGCYASINKYLTLNLGDKHLRRSTRAWADRIAYTESWRSYKAHYLKEWKEIRRLASMIMIACAFATRIHSFGDFILQRLTILGLLFSLTLSYYLSNELTNTGDHAADAANYFQLHEDVKYGVQALALINCAPQAILCWSICLFAILLAAGS